MRFNRDEILHRKKSQQKAHRRRQTSKANRTYTIGCARMQISAFHICAGTTLKPLICIHLIFSLFQPNVAINFSKVSAPVFCQPFASLDNANQIESAPHVNSLMAAVSESVTFIQIYILENVFDIELTERKKIALRW